MSHPFVARARRLAAALAACALLALPGTAAAQDEAADSLDMQAQFEQMGPMMGMMMSAMLNATLDVLSQPATADRMATFTRNYFDALVAKGFTREEALRIVVAVGIPLPGQQ